MTVESVSGYSWNECPNQRGISVRMLVEWVSGWSWNPQAVSMNKPSNGTHKDEMTQKEVLTAEVDSTNTLSFGFPYAGAQRATLELRKHPRWGSDVILQVERGQFLCNNYDGCSVSVRFGDGKPQRFSAGEPSDNRTTYIFISEYYKFVSQLRKVDEVVIEASFYQSGNQALKFSTADLDWK